jgi:hypothetical protein
MEEIIAEIQRIYNEPPPGNQLGLPSYYRNQLYDINAVICRLQQYYNELFNSLKELEDI